jgi:2-polyprenyl-3-methyl-5-hydroxy-6-metoxy-1,4-benzoquinol methylase
MISQEYREMNATLHAQKPTYGASGHRWAKEVQTYGTTDVLDYGCGKGTLAAALPFKIREYDPAVPAKAEPPEPADLVVCTDVLEHIEPDHLDAVLDDLRRVTRKDALLVVATRPAKKTLPDGRNAHLIIEDIAWWIHKIGSRWNINEASTDTSQAGEFLIRCCASSSDTIMSRRRHGTR